MKRCQFDGRDFDVAEVGTLAREGVNSGGCVKGCCLDISSMWMCGVTRSGGVLGGGPAGPSWK